MSLKPTDPAQPCVIRCWDEDGYSWQASGSCFAFSRIEAKRYNSPQEAWEVIAELRQAGFGLTDEGPSPNLSVQPA